MTTAYDSNVAVARMMQRAYGAQAMSECETRLGEALEDINVRSIATWIAVYVILDEMTISPERLLVVGQAAD